MKRDASGRPIQGSRGESGLTTRQELNMIGRAIRWPTSAEGRMASVDLLEEVIAGRVKCEVGDQIKAVEVYLKVEAMNLMDERAEAENVAVGSGERVVYLLPANGSEKVDNDVHFENEGDVVEFENNCPEACVEGERESDEITTPE